MADMTEGLPEKVVRIEQKLDALSESVDRRFEEVDKRFDEVSEHFVEQREYTEFAFERLRTEMVEGFTRLEGLIATNTNGLTRLERKFEQFIDHFNQFPLRRRSHRPPKKR